MTQAAEYSGAGRRRQAVFAAGAKPVLSVAIIDTPLGAMRAAADAQGLYFLHFADTKNNYAESALRAYAAEAENDAGAAGGGSAALALLRRELEAYFAGSCAAFTVPLHLAGHKPFRQAAWAALRRIPYGQTRSYGAQAVMMGAGRNFARAIGGANGANPFPLLIPCHRVIAADGRAGGYAGGQGRKQALLAHERLYAAIPAKKTACSFDFGGKQPLSPCFLAKAAL